MAWPQFAATLVIVAVALVGGGWAVYAHHDGSMHEGSVSYREYQSDKSDMVKRLERMENKLDGIGDKLKAMP